MGATPDGDSLARILRPVKLTAAVVLAWMESDGHCKNIMNPEFNELGVGYFYDSGSKYRHWWSQEFGKR